MAVPAESHTKAEETSADAPAKASRCFPGGMHDNVPDWSDPVCSCEAEPYWVAVAEQAENDRATPGEEDTITTSAPHRSQ